MTHNSNTPDDSVLRDVMLPRLEGVKRSGGNYMARCPAHSDQKASLSLGIGDRQPVVMNCKVGCSTEQILAAVGLTTADIARPREAGREDWPSGAVAVYDYRDENGVLLYQVIRTAAKKFWQRRPDPSARDGWSTKLGKTRRVPYRLRELAAGVAAGKTIFCVEGEKDVHALVKAGAVATCNPMGVGGGWREEYSQHFAGATVWVIADNDEPGKGHAAKVAASLRKVGCTVTVALPAIEIEKADAYDHLKAGHGLDDFQPLDAPPAAEVEPTPKQRRIVLTPASKIKPCRTVWGWDTTPEGAGPADMQGRFPAGSLVIGAGRAGIGKSQFAAWLVAMITRGQLLGCWFGQPRSVLYAATEDSWEMTIVPRLIAAGADLDRVFRLEVGDDEEMHARLTLPVDTARLAEAIVDNDVALVVLDPLLSMIDGTINDYRAREVRAALEPLGAAADRTRCLIFGLAHFTKAAGSDPLTLISGSGAFGQLIRAAVGFARDEEADGEAFVLSQIKNNLGRENLPSLSYVIQPVTVETDEGDAYVSRFHFTGEESAKSVRDLLAGGPADPHSADDQNDAVEWLRSFLADGEVAALDAFKAGDKVGFSKDVLKRAKKKAGAKSRKSASMEDSPWVWYLVTESGGSGGDEGGEGSANSEGSTKSAKGARPCAPRSSLPSCSLRNSGPDDIHEGSPDEAVESDPVKLRHLLPGGDSLPPWQEREAARVARDAEHEAQHHEEPPWPDVPSPSLIVVRPTAPSDPPANPWDEVAERNGWAG